jgi:hypothetical protein
MRRPRRKAEVKPMRLGCAMHQYSTTRATKSGLNHIAQPDHGKIFRSAATTSVKTMNAGLTGSRIS